MRCYVLAWMCVPLAGWGSIDGVVSAQGTCECAPGVHGLVQPVDCDRPTSEECDDGFHCDCQSSGSIFNESAQTLSCDNNPQCVRIECDVNVDCVETTGCCATTGNCVEAGTIGFTLPCFTDGCDCRSGVCRNGECSDCRNDRECASGCCADRIRIGGVVECEENLDKAVGATCTSSSGCDFASGSCGDDGGEVPEVGNPGKCVCTEDAHCAEDEECCDDGACEESCGTPAPTPPPTACPNGDVNCGEPHMQGLRGQRIDWSGVDGGWYSLIKDDNADLHINVRLTAPLPNEFSHRQLMTSLTVMSAGHSLVIEIENPYTIDTDGCPEGGSPCLANGGLRIFVDGQNVDELLRFSRQVPLAGGAMSVSASNLPVECRQFGGDRIWARMYKEMLEGRRQLVSGESLEDWILRFDHMAAPGWCAKYIAENDLSDLQSNHAIFKIETPSVTVRLNAGVNYQGDGELDWDGRVLPDLEFWQMDVGMHGLDVDNPALSGLLGETAHPVYDENGDTVMEGFEAFRGTVEDYRVSGALGTHFALLDKREEVHE